MCTFCTCLPIFQPKKVGCHEITNDETSENFDVDPLKVRGREERIHSSEIRGLCLMKCSSKTLQNLP